MMRRIRAWLQPLFFLGTNAVTLVGAVLTTSAALTIVGALVLEIVRGRAFHPYAGIVLYLVLPGVFVLGLLLIPAGALWRRRRLAVKGELPAEYPPIDFRHATLRRGAALVLSATFLNVAILSAASYQGIEYMDSNEFCGVTCHSVMAPEYAAFKASAHARVGCVECHIGPGAPWFVRSKLSGTRQLFAVAFDTHSRPIPSPVKHLRPARETCEHCHWPQKFHGDKFVVRTKYSSDEANTPLTTVLVLKIGGRGGSEGIGIHGRHLDERRPVSYVATDDRRQVIPRVSQRADDGTSVEYVSTDIKATQDELARGEHRTMDCMDCHNRPSHTFELPERAVDEAMKAGRISSALPFVKKKSVELLRTEYPDQPTALRRINEGLAEFYRASYPDVYRKDRSQVEAASQQIGAIYGRNVFPSMKVGWGTYPNNVGHEDFAGCFRCHDETHQAPGGKTITQSCDACHTILAQDEKDPKVLADLGLAP
jgi:hypothetical protein